MTLADARKRIAELCGLRAIDLGDGLKYVTIEGPMRRYDLATLDGVVALWEAKRLGWCWRIEQTPTTFTATAIHWKRLRSMQGADGVTPVEALTRLLLAVLEAEKEVGNG